MNSKVTYRINVLYGRKWYVPVVIASNGNHISLAEFSQRTATQALKVAEQHRDEVIKAHQAVVDAAVLASAREA